MPRRKEQFFEKKVYGKIMKEAEEKEQSDREIDDTSGLLKQAAEALSRAASTKDQRQELLKEVEAILSKLRIVDFPDLAESPVVQAFLKTMGLDDLRPGGVVAKGTLAERSRDWAWRDVNDMPRITFTPAESIPITFNGLTLYLVEDQECEVPRPFYDIYMEHRRALKQAQLNEAYLLGISDIPPHLNWQTEEGARIRAFSIQGRAFGKQGGHLGTGPIIDVEAESGE